MQWGLVSGHGLEGNVVDEELAGAHRRFRSDHNAVLEEAGLWRQTIWV